MLVTLLLGSSCSDDCLKKSFTYDSHLSICACCHEITPYVLLKELIKTLWYIFQIFKDQASLIAKYMPKRSLIIFCMYIYIVQFFVKFGISKWKYSKCIRMFITKRSKEYWWIKIKCLHYPVYFLTENKQLYCVLKSCLRKSLIYTQHMDSKDIIEN